MRRIWAPEKFCFWLPGVPRSRSVSSFVKLFKALGYKKTNAEHERGVRKIAIFAKNGYVLHVAVQPPHKGGIWHSKIGHNVNIYHTLDQIAGDEYGKPVAFMREQRPSRATRVLATGRMD